jgi:hypothetical protein
MGVRRQRACYSSLEVTKWFTDKPSRIGIVLYRQDTYLQNKSLLYSKMKSIEKGRLKLPLPLSQLGRKTRLFPFIVQLDGSLRYGYPKRF